MEIGQAISQRILDRGFAKNVAKVGGGAVVANLIMVGTSPILSRLYSPFDFGVLGQFTAILGILATVGCLRYEIAIPLASEDRAGASVVAVALTVLATLTALLCLGLAFFGPHVAKYITPQVASWYAWLLPIALCGTCSYQVTTYWAIRTKAFSCVASTRVYQAAAVCLISVCLALTSFGGPLGLLLGATAGSGLGALRLARVSNLQQWINIKRFHWRSLKPNALLHARTAGASSLSGALNLAANQAPVLLMTASFGPAQTGLLVVAMRLISAADLLIAGAVGQVFLGEAADRFRSNPETLPSFFRRTVVVLAVTSGIFSGAVWLLAPAVVPVVFGRAWVEAGVFARWLSIRTLASMICSPVSTIAYILGKQLHQVVWEVTRTAAVVGGFWWCGAAGISPRGSVIVYALISCGAYATWLALLNGYVAKARLASPAGQEVCCDLL